jgi:SAM-dependent methyltransferase
MVTSATGRAPERQTTNLDRFSGFADLYDEQRPQPPDGLGQLLIRYAGVHEPTVVDLGSGTGLSSRWAARWAGSVVGVEPNDDMRHIAESHRDEQGGPRSCPLTYRPGRGERTGLDVESADIVLAVQAMHWMEPASTLAEVARVLRPGGVFAAIDADWPPVAGSVCAEGAWIAVHRRIRVLEARVARGETGARLRRPIDGHDLALEGDDLSDPHLNRVMPGSVRSWAKREHLRRLDASGHFGFVREVLFQQPVAGGEGRFVALMRSQGSYQELRRAGLDDDDVGMSEFEAQVHRAFVDSPSPLELSFSWRARIGVTSG